MARLALPLATLLALATATAVTNTVLWLWLRTRRPLTTAWIGSILALGVSCYAALFVLPFSPGTPEKRTRREDRQRHREVARVAAKARRHILGQYS